MRVCTLIKIGVKVPKRTARRRLRLANWSIPLISKKLQFNPKEFKGSRILQELVGKHPEALAGAIL